MYRLQGSSKKSPTAGLKKVERIIKESFELGEDSECGIEVDGIYIQYFKEGEIKKGDTLSVSVSFLDLPAVTFRINGEEVVGKNIKRVRGNVAPVIGWRGGEVRAAFERIGWKEDARGGEGIVKAINLI